MVMRLKLSLLVCACVGGLGMLAQPARAQSPAPPKLVVDKTAFKLPIRMPNHTNFKEFLLYMKEGSGQWALRGRTPATSTHFNCKVPHDGEYWFTLVAVDEKGRTHPPDLSGVEPQVIVVVNSGTAARDGSWLPDPVSIVPTPNAPTPNAPPSAVSPPVMENTNYRLPEPPRTGASQPRPAGSAGLVNSTKVAVDYNIAKVGTSGIGRIDIYATADDGQTWQRVGEDAGTRSPVAVNLPGEGVWGIRLVACNGNGLGGRIPVPGDKPSSTIEVDVSGPNIHNMEIDSVSRKGGLEIRWKISDKNLGAEPISLFHGPSVNGPWQPIGVRLKNDGRYMWQLPRDVNPQLYVRMEAVDQAGNVSRFDLRDPLILDTTEPDLNIIGITPIQLTGHRSGGN
jgi:hypothetical protein